MKGMAPMKRFLLALVAAAALASNVTAQTDQPYQDNDTNQPNAIRSTADVDTDVDATVNTDVDNDNDNLPATASDAPLLFVGGLAALMAGLSLRPRRPV
jgi:Ni/Co efflux regulator RcnB